MIGAREAPEALSAQQAATRESIAWAEAAAVGAVVVGFVLLSLPLFNQPFGRDQGIFATIADAINRGQLPYKDAWDHKPPGIDYTYALAFRVFGRSWVAVHLLEMLAMLGGMAALWAAIRPLNRWAALATAATFGAATVLQFEWWDRGQAEMFIAAISAAGMALAFASRRGVLWSLGAGVLLGSLVWFKPTAGLLGLAGLAVVVAQVGVSPGRRLALMRAVIALAAGAALSVAVPALLLAWGGAFGDLWQAVVQFNTLHIQTGANLTVAATGWATEEFLWRMGWLTPLALLGAWWLGRARAKLAALVVVWLLAALAGVWSQGKFFSYHWSVAVPPLAVFAGFGVVDLAAALRSARGGWVTAAVAALVALALGQQLLADQASKLGRDLPYLLGQTSTDAYQQQFGHNINNTDVYSFVSARRTAEYLNQHTRADDTVLVWGFQALVNWLADRPAPTRFIFSYPVTIERPESTLRRQYRETFLREFTANPPAYVVLVSKDVNPIQTVDSVALLDSFPEFKALLEREYSFETDIAEFRLLRRKG